jgi:hypothetical protein
MAETKHIKICGSNYGYGVVVKFNEQIYLATPSHVLFGATEPHAEYDGKSYSIATYYLSNLRDFALLELADTTLLPALDIIIISESSLLPCAENFYFDFDINNSTLKNITNYRGLSGTLIDTGKQRGLFQGYKFNRQNQKKIFKAVNLTIFPNELHKVDFEKIRAEFLQKNLKNSK